MLNLKPALVILSIKLGQKDFRCRISADIYPDRGVLDMSTHKSLVLSVLWNRILTGKDHSSLK